MALAGICAACRVVRLWRPFPSLPFPALLYQPTRFSGLHMELHHVPVFLLENRLLLRILCMDDLVQLLVHFYPACLHLDLQPIPSLRSFHFDSPILYSEIRIAQLSWIHNNSMSPCFLCGIARKQSIHMNPKTAVQATEIGKDRESVVGATAAASVVLHS